jgi:hypothetical protein
LIQFAAKARLPANLPVKLNRRSMALISECLEQQQGWVIGSQPLCILDAWNNDLVHRMSITSGVLYTRLGQPNDWQVMTPEVG